MASSQFCTQKSKFLWFCCPIALAWTSLPNTFQKAARSGWFLWPLKALQASPTSFSTAEALKQSIPGSLEALQGFVLDASNGRPAVGTAAPFHGEATLGKAKGEH